MSYIEQAQKVLDIEIEALQKIFFVNQRAPFEFALSRNSFSEVVERGDHRYFQWVCDVGDYWETILDSYGTSSARMESTTKISFADDSSLGYLSEKDRILLRDALQLECEAFLTVDRRLLKNSAHLNKKLGLRLLAPSEYWDVLKPWARLYV